MKYFFTTVFTIFLLNTVIAQSPKVYRCFCNNNALCSSSLVLYSDSSFVYEHGCEASSHLSFGQWRQKKDSIYFTQKDPRTIPVIKNVQSSIVPGDSIWVTILDRKGVNMTSLLSLGLDVDGRGTYMMSNDSSGQKQFVYKRAGGRISLRTLNKLLGQRISIPVNGDNNFVISLNISSDWIWNKHADWSATGNFSALKRGNTLYSNSPKMIGVYELQRDLNK